MRRVRRGAGAPGKGGLSTGIEKVFCCFRELYCRGTGRGKAPKKNPLPIFTGLELLAYTASVTTSKLSFKRIYIYYILYIRLGTEPVFAENRGRRCLACGGRTMTCTPGEPLGPKAHRREVADGPSGGPVAPTIGHRLAAGGFRRGCQRRKNWSTTDLHD